MRRENEDRQKAGLPQRATRPRRGGGGAWRTFVSRALRGKHGEAHADMKELGRQYRALTADQKTELAADASAATVRHRLGGASCAKRARDVDRAIEGDRKRRRGAALAQGATVPVLGDDLNARLEDLPAILENAESDYKAVRAVGKDEAHATAMALKGWRDTKGKQVRDAFVHQALALETCSTQLVGEAQIGDVSLLSWQYPSKALLPAAVAHLAQDPNLARDCIENWEDTLHNIVRHDAQPPIPPLPDKPPTWGCGECRSCLCGPRGDGVWAMKVWFCSRLKEAFNTKASIKVLSDGNAVCRLTVDPEPESDVEGGDEVEAGELEEEFARFFHLSLFSGSPYKVWLRALEWPKTM